VNWTNEEGLPRFKPALMEAALLQRLTVTDTLKHTDADGATVAEAALLSRSVIMPGKVRPREPSTAT